MDLPADATDAVVAADTAVGRALPDLEGGEGTVVEMEGRPSRPTWRGRGGGTAVAAISAAPHCRRAVPARQEGEGETEQRRRRVEGGERERRRWRGEGRGDIGRGALIRDWSRAEHRAISCPPSSLYYYTYCYM
uniref:Uncharacterized protein n=1 Tax=Oryza sativa subsp. japonica TaxID=39947 RepID=Q67VG4_ORYSJ|nr:hypothetical protein [Oryza sativa Japonica Group]